MKRVSCVLMTLVMIWVFASCFDIGFNNTNPDREYQEWNLIHLVDCNDC